MQSNNNPKAVNPGQDLSEADELQEDNLEWLLDQDLDEPEETLFKVDYDPVVQAELSPLEAAVAGRPMTRDGGTADDLSSFVGEEIVFAAESQPTSDIYARDEQEAPIAEQPSAEMAGILTVDHSQRNSRASAQDSPEVALGSDILGLTDEDNIGEQLLVIRKNKAVAASPQAPATPVVESEAVQSVEPVAESLEAVTQAEETDPLAADLELPELDAELDLEPLVEADAELDMAPSLDMAPAVDIDSELTLEPIEEAASELDLEPVLEADTELDLESVQESETELTLESLVESEAELNIEPVEEASPASAPEVPTTPAPVATGVPREAAPGVYSLDDLVSAAPEQPAEEPVQDLSDFSLEKDTFALGDDELSLEGDSLALDDTLDLAAEFPDSLEDVLSSDLQELEADAEESTLDVPVVDEAQDALPQDLSELVALDEDTTAITAEDLSLEPQDFLADEEGIGDSFGQPEAAEVSEFSPREQAPVTEDIALDTPADDTLTAETTAAQALDELFAKAPEGEAFLAGVLDDITADGGDAIDNSEVDGEEYGAHTELTEAPAISTLTEPGAFEVANEGPADNVPVDPAMDSPSEALETLESVVSDTYQQRSAEVADVKGPASQEVAENTATDHAAEAANDAGEDAAPLAAYVSSYRAPSNDDAFDQFLLEGEHLEHIEVDPEELSVARTEGTAELDTSLEVNIDYHEDFTAMEGFNGPGVSRLAQLATPLFAEVSAQLQQRLAELGEAGDSVEADLRLAADESMASQYRAEGYEIITQLLPTCPAPLQGVSAQERDSVYLRLVRSDNDDICNRLFLEDPSEVEEDVAAAPEAEVTDELVAEEPVDLLPEVELEAPELDTVEEVVEDVELELTSDNVESDMVEADPLEFEVVAAEVDTFDGEVVELEVLAPEVDVEAPVEIEVPAAEQEDGFAGFDALDDFDTDDLPVAGNDDVDSIFDEAVFSEDITAELDEVEAPEGNIDDAFEVLSDADQATTDEAAVAADAEAEPIADDGATDVFGANLFDEDLDDSLLAAGDASDVDVDALFDTFAGSEQVSDEVCGISMEEFQEDGMEPETLSNADRRPAARAEARTVVASESSWCVPASIQFSYTSQSTNEVFADFLDAFLEEGSNELEKLEDAIERWEGAVDDDDARATVGRVLHTLKGIAKGVGLQRYGTLIHNFETLLEGLPQPNPGGETEYFRIVNAWLDTAVQGLDYIQENRADILSEVPQVGGAAPADVPVAAPEEESAPAPEVADKRETAREKERDKQLAEEGAKALAAQQTVRLGFDKLDQMLNLTNQAQQLGVRSAQSVGRGKRAASELEARLSSVRLHISKIADRALLNVTATGAERASEMDALEMDQYSELQEAANILREGVEDLGDLVNLASRQNTLVEALLKQQSTVVSTLGAALQAARVLPVSRLMPGLRRIVRTVSADLGKSVSFKVLNEIGSLDRDNHARLQIILEHMVRNALDHGIEAPEDRLVAGKPTAGRITIDVRKDGADYLIALADDGKGIDPEVMREAAFNKGLDVDVDALSDAEAQRLIFHKGFSTAAQLSEISGRGVGMDIVLSELQQVGGDIQIASRVGHGTTFTIRIPSNVTLNGALLVTAGEASYAIPLDGLVAVEQVEVETFFQAVENHSRLRLLDMDCEPAYLGSLCSNDPLPDRGSWANTVPVIIAGSEERYMAIAIDNVEQALELVIRSLGNQFSNVPGVAGAATTADGDAIVALDLNNLVHSMADEAMSPMSVDSAQNDHLLVLVVDDSRTQRMVATSQFDTVGVETITAENGMVAIDLLNTCHRLPDVVLLDVEMPVKDGIQTLREIRKSSRFRHLPVIMVTSRTGAKHRALAEEAGCNGYMGKPFNFPGLVEQINALTGFDLQL